jgi:hypothetical protein
MDGLEEKTSSIKSYPIEEKCSRSKGMPIGLFVLLCAENSHNNI